MRITQRFKPWPTVISAPLTLTLAGCQASSNMGAAPRHWDLSKLPRAKDIAAYAESGTTAGAQRTTQRVGTALAAKPSLASSQLQVQGLKSGVMVFSEQVSSVETRKLAIQLMRSVASVRDVVDRTTLP